MDNKKLREVLPLVNSPDFTELMNIYLDYELEIHYRTITQSEDMVKIYQAQGAIRVLERMKEMRVKVQTLAKGD